jgi:acetylornithine deacetylase/succinyl-diaminopimelate desuccinylase-like protein
MAEMVRKDLLALGFRRRSWSRRAGIPAYGAYYDAGADKTLAVYMMYDVQPVEPTGWSVNAFEARWSTARLARC